MPTDRPKIICHMTSSLDGGLHPSRYTTSPDGTAKDWTALYEQLHDSMDADGWIVGRVTMAEMAKGDPATPDAGARVERPVHIANTAAESYAVTVDRSAKLHFGKGDVGGDHVVVLLGGDVADAHLAELAASGVSYVVSDGAGIALPAALATLKHDFGIETLLLEGGGGINGTFLAAGLVDELSVVMTSALDGGTGAERIVKFDDGLKGKVTLSLTGCEQLAHGVVHLRYAVAAA
ncbi:dihydrofolate reductase family protein [Sphingomonas sp. TREG-RG-20F-R18-01]|uniref:dihydrofolate reductase family protein n=1 Tax=Sphingomonas sp. TREG-RG-20F-R18-01 TaxID=2914982 RepID=UPI001F56C270|nr:dihydrofolate reductase family protein [Sphingomonas sp. TREG-RG-20F-R18-01]